MIKTTEEAHAAGRRDGEAKLGPIAPRTGPPGSHQRQLHEAYMQSYRDASVAAVGIPERRVTPRSQNPMKKINPEYARKAQVAAGIADDSYIQGGLPGMQDELAFLRRSDADPVIIAEVQRLYRKQLKRRRGMNPRKQTVWKRPRRSSARSLAGHKRLAKLAYSAGRADASAARAPNTYYTAGPYASSYRLGFHARRSNPRRQTKRAHKAPHGKTITTTTRATVTRRENRRVARRALVVLYATKRGKRLKYLGNGKFGERGRPKLFKGVPEARLAAWVLRDSHRRALRGWKLTAGA